MKSCSRCRISKISDEFHRVQAAWDGRSNYCKLCTKQYDRERGLRIKYDLSIADYASRLEQQDGQCAICRESPSEDECLAVDHEHATGKVRGLLCRQCNLALGGFRDSPALLRQAADYVESRR